MVKNLVIALTILIVPFFAAAGADGSEEDGLDLLQTRAELYTEKAAAEFNNSEHFVDLLQLFTDFLKTVEALDTCFNSDPDYTLLGFVDFSGNRFHRGYTLGQIFEDFNDKYIITPVTSAAAWVQDEMNRGIVKMKTDLQHPPNFDVEGLLNGSAIAQLIDDTWAMQTRLFERPGFLPMRCLMNHAVDPFKNLFRDIVINFVPHIVIPMAQWFNDLMTFLWNEAMWTLGQFTGLPDWEYKVAKVAGEAMGETCVDLLDRVSEDIEKAKFQDDIGALMAVERELAGEMSVDMKASISAAVISLLLQDMFSALVAVTIEPAMTVLLGALKSIMQTALHVINGLCGIQPYYGGIKCSLIMAPLDLFQGMWNAHAAGAAVLVIKEVFNFFTNRKLLQPLIATAIHATTFLGDVSLDLFLRGTGAPGAATHEWLKQGMASFEEVVGKIATWAMPSVAAAVGRCETARHSVAQATRVLIVSHSVAQGTQISQQVTGSRVTSPQDASKCMGYDLISFLVGMFPCSATGTQIWNFDVDLGFFKVGDLCMQPALGGEGGVSASPCDFSDHQKWVFKDGLVMTQTGELCLQFNNGAISLSECKENNEKQTFELVTPLDGLDGEEISEEFIEQTTESLECKGWCVSKKHKNKPWTKKCSFFSCAGCDACADVEVDSAASSNQGKGRKSKSSKKEKKKGKGRTATPTFFRNVAGQEHSLCEDWCHNGHHETQSWTDKCQWAACENCDECDDADEDVSFVRQASTATTMNKTAVLSLMQDSWSSRRPSFPPMQSTVEQALPRLHDDTVEPPPVFMLDVRAEEVDGALVLVGTDVNKSGARGIVPNKRCVPGAWKYDKTGGFQTFWEEQCSDGWLGRVCIWVPVIKWVHGWKQTGAGGCEFGDNLLFIGQWWCPTEKTTLEKADFLWIGNFAKCWDDENWFDNMARMLDSFPSVIDMTADLNDCLNGLSGADEKWRIDSMTNFWIDRALDPIRFFSDLISVYVSPTIDALGPWSGKTIQTWWNDQIEMLKAVTAPTAKYLNKEWGLVQVEKGWSLLADKSSGLVSVTGMGPSRCLVESAGQPVFDSSKDAIAALLVLTLTAPAKAIDDAVSAVTDFVMEMINGVLSSDTWIGDLSRDIRLGVMEACLTQFNEFNVKELATGVETNFDQDVDVVGIMVNAINPFMNRLNDFVTNTIVDPAAKTIVALASGFLDIVLHAIDALAGLIPYKGAIIASILTSAAAFAKNIVFFFGYKGFTTVFNAFFTAGTTFLKTTMTRVGMAVDSGLDELASASMEGSFGPVMTVIQAIFANAMKVAAGPTAWQCQLTLERLSKSLQTSSDYKNQLGQSNFK